LKTPTKINPSSQASEALDLDKLAYAVAMAETKDCTTGTGKYNNCHGIMAWDAQGNRYPRRFNSKEESYEYFKKLWVKNYGGFPTISQAVSYVGNDSPGTWLYNVTYYYNK